MSIPHEDWTEIRYEEMPVDGINSDTVRLADGMYYSVSGRDPDVLIFRYSWDGVLDSTFGDKGIVRLAAPGAYTYYHSLSLHNDVLFVSCLAGTAEMQYSAFALYKLDAKTGALDKEFGEQGTKLLPIPVDSRSSAAARDAGQNWDKAPQLPDGKHRQIISYGMAQFDPAGELDLTFAETGMIEHFPKSAYEYRTQHITPYTVAGQHAGFLMCGSFMLGGFTRGWVGAIGLDGAVLKAFGSEGETHFMRLPENDLAHLVVRSVVQVGDYIYVVGLGIGLPKTLFLYRLGNDGKIDSDYNGGAPVFLEPGNSPAFHLAADGDGMLIGVSSTVSVGSIYRVDASGKLDTAFGGKGWLNLPKGYDSPMAINVTEHAGSRFLEVWGHAYLLRHSLLPAVIPRA